MVPVSADAQVFDTPDGQAVRHFARTGWVRTRTLDDAGVTRLRGWIDDLADRPDEDGAWLHYRELTDDGPKLCRTENFVPYHDGLRAFLTTGPMLDVASALLGEPAVLYKEKVNYKLPGGAGYSAHQDAPAYRFVTVHVSCMVAVDDATVDNGCLEVASGMHDAVLPMDDRGCIEHDVAAALVWAPVEVRAGDTLWFHSRTPHRSGANRSTSPRRAIYPTYNAASEGDLRADYYRQKLQEFAADGGSADRVQVSLIGDFEGRPVNPRPETRR
ncbi:MAG: protein involved in biosynthesis of mitomycin antibiotics/polyketide fumonisin [Acidimicrobiales bacterium]|nr:protein involved in biosynthesis of mitomycin antibiotics/polyketide fumonisin [Acidimicrobiales bacterium]